LGALATEKRIAVADFGRSCVHIFDRNDDGTNVNVTKVGGLGESQGKLHSPCGIAIGPKGEIIVSDNKKRDIQVHEGFVLSICGLGPAIY
jgi:DNA-binding beta-propeller fold protein YncE